MLGSLNSCGLEGLEVYCFVKTTKPVQSSDEEMEEALCSKTEESGCILSPYLTDLCYALANQTENELHSDFTLVIGRIFLGSFSRYKGLHPESDVLALLFSPFL